MCICLIEKKYDRMANKNSSQLSHFIGGKTLMDNVA